MTLDDAYANGRFIANADTYPPRWERAAADFRAATRGRLDVPYGDTPRQRLDLFLPEGAPRGVVMFVHGGYWLRFDKSTWSWLAAGPVAAGWAVAMPSYDLCPSVRIAEITRQIARAVDCAAELVAGPVRLTGHSAGGHLVARMACTDIDLATRGRIEKVVPISPLADLAPLMETSMNADLRIDAAEAEAESPIHRTPAGHPVTVWVGAQERPAFVDQAGWLAEAWDVLRVIEPERHHFDVIDGLADRHSRLCRTLLV
ncbi:possible esterase/lipase/thioesterase [Oceanicola granulosus HTCC2516]|uniref:Possible esterase/lipase/thioesterase n=1 Tax=Oceanicola granulosus (strain ATCC BAA-861 / DSM 15982 / KCTC 12143 / HTCC2516) TaxID=314256 RepID=Q2CI66_OCEGH|nr:alpha/beta hydrolase [Oceanicola granulosus]EAR52392.1 possible esterase/lipase/thioesterase [Oceanicola granulosus HTCC2516]